MLLQALEEARHALSAEQARTLKLEAQLAEAREKLGTVADLERALERYQKVEAATAAAERQAAVKKEGNSGLWGYITGQQ
jgi:membrane-bound lytic murein transglycosylase B